MIECNVFDDISDFSTTQEIVNVLLEKPNLRIERIISTGQRSDWYDQIEEEYVILLQGTAELEYEDYSADTLIKGDTIYLPAHKKHRVSYTSTEPPCIWLCVFWKEKE